MFKRLMLLVTILFLIRIVYTYGYTAGNRWKTPDLPIGYTINPDEAPTGSITAIVASFDTWQDAANDWISFEYLGESENTSSDEDDENLIYWGYLPPDGIAAANPYYDDTGQIIECDLRFNSTYSWSATIQCPGNKWDVRSVATHEIGHWLFLGDLKGGGDTEKTMYAYMDIGETKKRTLHSDDIAGVLFLYHKVRVSEDYTSVQDAANNALSGQTILVDEYEYHVSGTIPEDIRLQICGDMLVGQDETLTLLTGSNVELSYEYDVYSIKVQDNTNGIITRQSGVTIEPKDISVKSSSTVKGFYPSIQSAINIATSGQDVWVGPGSYTTEDIDMKDNVDVKTVSTKQTINGDVDFDNTDCELEDFFVNGAITISNSDVILDGITSNKSSGTAVSISSYSSVYIYDFISDDGADVGIYSYYDNEVYLDGIELEYIDEKALHQPTYDYMEVYDFYFCDSDNYDIYKYPSADIYLDEYCTFTDSPPLVCYGVREIEYPTYYDICSSKKASDPDYNDLTAIDHGIIFQKTDEKESYNLGMNLLRQISQQRLAAIKADFEVNGKDFAKEYTEAITFLKQAVSQLNDETLIRTAIGRIVSSYFQLDQDENAHTYLTSLRENSKYTSFLLVIDSQLINYYLRQDDPETALYLVNNLLEMSLDDEERAALLNLKGFIYWKHLSDPDQAILCYQEVLTNYSNTPSSEFALAQLEKMDESAPDSQLAEPLPTDELVLEGYPNPFNPTATMRFSLPKSIEVTLIVYDMLGREVVRLVDGFRDAGQYEITWDGRDSKGLEVPTGIYITKLSTPLETKVIRMLMMK
ncbi:MAG: matrixin family metalloprotease [Tissierellales bacterium]|nr:matrixin family metalloprotease [Tissierellales bacterium]